MLILLNFTSQMEKIGENDLLVRTSNFIGIIRFTGDVAPKYLNGDKKFRFYQ